MISLLCLVVRVAGGDLDHAPVRHDHGLEKAQRTAVPRRQKLHFDCISSRCGAHSVRSCRSRSGRAPSRSPSVITHSVVVPSAFLTARASDPWGLVNLMLVTVPDSSFSFHVVHAREGMMSLQRPAAIHTVRATHPKVRSSFLNLLNLAGRREFYHELLMPRFEPFPAVNAK